MNELMRRRRGLMVSQGGLRLNDVPAGSIVDFDGREFVAVALQGNAVLLLCRYLLATQRTMGKSPAGNYDFDGGTIDKYLNTSWYAALSAAAQQLLATMTISYPASDGTALVDKEIQRKVALPTRQQLTNDGTQDGIVLAALKTYNNTQQTATARLATLSGGAAHAWWSMSASSTTKYWGVNATGGAASYGYNDGGIYVRPIIAVSKFARVNLINGVYTVQL